VKGALSHPLFARRNLPRLVHHNLYGLLPTPSFHNHAHTVSELNMTLVETGTNKQMPPFTTLFITFFGALLPSCHA
jgi:hypothetical protein